MARHDPLHGTLVTIVGGSGFLGDHVAQALLTRGARVRIASRHPKRAYRLKPLAQLGQIQFIPCDATRRESVDAALAGADAVVNLVGTFAGDVMHTICGSAQNIAEAAASGCTAMVHVSAIGADRDSPAAYARAKAESEEVVRSAFPRATILRPGVLFGEDDRFVQMFAGLISALPVLPVFAPRAQLQPLFVDDAAEAVANSLADPASHAGKIYEIAGPETVTMLQLNRQIAASQNRKRVFLPVPDALSALFAALPGTPMNGDQWTLLKAGNKPSGEYPGMAELGIAPRPLSLFLDRWMTRYRRYGRFNETVAG
ncbi:3-beta-hydroxy-Delta(5)-steroid dehydrogenase [Tsuneonella deserti]|uniref:3-beta-hydroxy-Delta(5)-steroid dehydrogenase n=1 Tax=Tsuneonella deserti TaxID=2035528 RepID=A0ABQ1SBA8_9SPHN|nr:complex I NDUFA9 subunit family protein [Tsuneonella deserti]GGE05786.1 3-beta-hydroxy-Delta(5)-steroid dehydrogenase [Tsuneonella deserti]